MSDSDLHPPAGTVGLTGAEDYRRMYEMSAIGIFRATPEGRFIMANPAGVRMHGYESEAELLQAVRDIRHEIYVDPSDRDTPPYSFPDGVRITIGSYLAPNQPPYSPRSSDVAGTWDRRTASTTSSTCRGFRTRLSRRWKRCASSCVIRRWCSWTWACIQASEVSGSPW